jgi:hypothetical protein
MVATFEQLEPRVALAVTISPERPNGCEVCGAAILAVAGERAVPVAAWPVLRAALRLRGHEHDTTRWHRRQLEEFVRALMQP